MRPSIIGGLCVIHCNLDRRRFVAGTGALAVAGWAGCAKAIEAPALEIVKLAENIWLHRSWKLLPDGSPFSSNGLIVKGRSRGLIVDTTMPEKDMPELIAWARHLSSGLPLQLVSTHAHGDRMSGIEIARAAGVSTYAFHLGRELAPKRGLPEAEHGWFGYWKRFDLGGRRIDFYYPGPAHSRDNIVAYVPDVELLFGGCMLRAMADTDLGSVADADLEHWPRSMKRLIGQYGRFTKIAIPGHGMPGDARLLYHTRDLVNAAARSQA